MNEVMKQKVAKYNAEELLTKRAEVRANRQSACAVCAGLPGHIERSSWLARRPKIGTPSA